MNFSLMQHQKDAVDFAVSNNGIAAFFHEVGCGKTLSALSVFTELQKSNPELKLIVICPLSLIYGAWTREIEKFFPQYNWCDMHGINIKNCRKSVDIYVLNFEYLISEKKFKYLKDIILQNTACMCVIDESSKMKNHKAKTTDRILTLKPFFNHRIVMSGTPAPNVEWEYWPQMYFLDSGILGQNFYKFKNTHFALRRGNQMVPGQFMTRHTIRTMHNQGFKYEIIPQRRKAMFERMRSWCHTVKASECIDLPEEIDEFRDIYLTAKQKKAYKSMKSNYIAELPGDVSAIANIALTKLMKLRQITSGFAINDNNEAVSLDEKNPKIDALVDIIEEVGDQQMIIWCQFHWEIDAISAILRDYGGVSQLHGRVPHNQRNQYLNDFLAAKNRFLVAHPASAAHGLTLTNCHIAVFFSLDYSMEGYSQARGRIYRKGQKINCLYFHLIAKDTIDEDVLRIVQKKETAREVAERYLIQKDDYAGKRYTKKAD